MKPAPAWIPQLGAWIPKLEFRGGECEEAGVWCDQSSKLQSLGVHAGWCCEAKMCGECESREDQHIWLSQQLSSPTIHTWIVDNVGNYLEHNICSYMDRIFQRKATCFFIRLESGFRRNFCETIWVREKSAPGLTAIILPCDLQSPTHGLSSWSCWRARVQLVQEAGVIWK